MLNIPHPYSLNSSPADGFTTPSSSTRKAKSAGKHPETGEKLRWMYYEDYLKLPEEKAFYKYLNFFKKWKDDLNIPKIILNSPKKFEAWVKERYYENIEQCTNLLKWIEKYRNEECTFEELVNNSKIGNRLHCRIKEYKGDKYIEQYGGHEGAAGCTLTVDKFCKVLKSKTL